MNNLADYAKILLSKITVANFIKALIDTPLIWMILALSLFSQTIFFNVNLLDWNIVELTLGKNLVHGHGYVWNIGSATAIWRPPFIPGVIALFQIFTDNPIIIINSIYLASVESLVLFFFYISKNISGTTSAHATDALILSTSSIVALPALHMHGFSHIGFMLLIGPCIFLAISQDYSYRKSFFLGILFGLITLTRPESIIIFAGYLLNILYLKVVKKKSISSASILLLIATFLAINLSWSSYVSHEVKKYNLYPSHSIAAFYNSEGWVFPDEARGDTEAEGWNNAIAKYGHPEIYGYSLIKVIAQNPEPIFLRIKKNYEHFYNTLVIFDFIYIKIILFFIFFILFNPNKFFRDNLFFIASGLVAPLFFLILHVSNRYISIGIPFLLILFSTGYGGLIHLISKFNVLNKKFISIACLLIVLLMTFNYRKNLYTFQELSSNKNIKDKIHRQILLNQSIGMELNKISSIERIQLIPRLLVTSDSLLYPYLISYYSNQPCFMGESGAYPRDKIFSVTPNTPNSFIVDETSLPEFYKNHDGKNSTLLGVKTFDGKRYYIFKV